MNEWTLHQELDKVGARYRRLRLYSALAVAWGVLALAGAVVLFSMRSLGYSVPGAALLALGAIALLCVPVLMAWSRRSLDPLAIARKVEQKHPDLDARLLSALEQKPDESTGQL